MGCDSVAALKTECEVQIHRLDEKITDDAIPDAEVARIEAELARLPAEIQTIQRTKDELVRRESEDRGTIKGSLGDLPERILATERRLETCRAAIRDLNTDRKAAEMARDLFVELAEDFELLLEKLAQDIAATYGSIVGAPRTVRLGQLDPQSASIIDAGGASRSLGNLSSGTRDAFLLAARLSLAGSMREGDGIIVLDDPFHAVDKSRAVNLLRLLERFHADRGWQIILFSKEESLAPLCREIFTDTTVHLLSRAHVNGHKIPAVQDA